MVNRSVGGRSQAVNAFVRWGYECILMTDNSAVPQRQSALPLLAAALLTAACWLRSGGGGDDMSAFAAALGCCVPCDVDSPVASTP